MIRARFKANLDDPRSVNWPIEHPYWISGTGEDYSIVVAYADDIDYIKKNWPDAEEIDVMEENTTYKFTDRFPQPEWHKITHKMLTQVKNVMQEIEHDYVFKDTDVLKVDFMIKVT